jgi:hypothetical protein
MAQLVPGHQLPEITIKEVEVLRESWFRPGNGRRDGPRCRSRLRPPLATADGGWRHYKAGFFTGFS